VAMRTTCIKNVKLKSIKTKTDCQHAGYFYYTVNVNWAAQNPQLGRGLDTAALKHEAVLTLNLVKNYEVSNRKCN